MQNLSLHEILDEGLSGEIKTLDYNEWKLLEYLIERSGELQYNKGVRDGIKKAHKEQQLILEGEKNG